MKNQLINELNKLDTSIKALKLEAVAKDKEARRWFLEGLVDPSFTKEGHDKFKKEVSKIEAKCSDNVKEAIRVEGILCVLHAVEEGKYPSEELDALYNLIIQDVDSFNPDSLGEEESSCYAVVYQTYISHIMPMT